MKKIVQIIVITFLAVMFTACGNNDGKKKQPINRYTPYGGNTPFPNGNNNGLGPNFNPNQQTQQFTASWGEVIQHPQQPSFQQSIYRFVSASSDPLQTVGPVSGQSGQSTGVRFAGKVQTQNGVPVPAQSQLYILIFDQWAAQGLRPPGQSVFRLVNGQITQSGATLTFQDNFGTLQMQGNFVGNFFQGTIIFQNNRFWDNQGTPQPDYLGQFNVARCGFFTCSNF